MHRHIRRNSAPPSTDRDYIEKQKLKLIYKSGLRISRKRTQLEMEKNSKTLEIKNQICLLEKIQKEISQVKIMMANLGEYDYEV